MKAKIICYIDNLFNTLSGSLFNFRRFIVCIAEISVIFAKYKLSYKIGPASYTKAENYYYNYFTILQQ